MSVNGLDHVNVRTRDMAETVAFYRDVLGFVAGAPPNGLDPARITWMYDGDGRALFHLTRADGDVADSTGAVDHVALDCSGHAAMVAHLEALGVAYRLNEVASIDLKQIFVTDPGGVRLELNFRAGRH